MAPVLSYRVLRPVPLSATQNGEPVERESPHAFTRLGSTVAVDEIDGLLTVRYVRSYCCAKAEMANKRVKVTIATAELLLLKLLPMLRMVVPPANRQPQITADARENCQFLVRELSAPRQQCSSGIALTFKGNLLTSFTPPSGADLLGFVQTGTGIWPVVD